MNPDNTPSCPECDLSQPPLDRRGFFRMAGGLTATALAGEFGPNVAQERATPPAAAGARPAEDLVRDLYAGLNDWQRSHVVYPWNHTGTGRIPARLGTYNTCIGKAIGETYTRAQRELIERILR